MWPSSVIIAQYFLFCNFTTDDGVWTNTESSFIFYLQVQWDTGKRRNIENIENVHYIQDVYSNIINIKPGQNLD